MKIEVKKNLTTHTVQKNVAAHVHGMHIFIFLPSHQDVLEAKCEPVTEVPPQGGLGVLSVSSLRRSVSQVMDGKSLTGDDEAWDPNISGHDSGMVRDPKNVC